MKNIFITNNDRKTIKKQALEEPKGTLVKAFACILLISALINYFIICVCRTINYNNEIEVVNGLLGVINLIVIAPLFLNFMNMFLLNSKDELYSFSDLFKKPKRALKYTWFFTLISIAYFLITFIISLLPFVGYILNLIISIIVIPVFILLPLVFLENENLKLKELIEKTFKVISQNRPEFYGMLLSYTGWLILGLFTFGILYLWLVPYIFIALTYQYNKWTNDKEYKTEQTLSNAGVIITFIIGFIILSIISFINVPSSFNKFIGTITNQEIESKGNVSIAYGGAEITFDSPKNYQLAYKSDSSRTYTNNDNIVQYSIYLATAKEVKEMDKDIVNKLKEQGKVSEEDFTLTVNEEKIQGYKYNATTDEENISSVIAYYPKGNFVVTITLSNSQKELSKDDLKPFITIY